MLARWALLAPPEFELSNVIRPVSVLLMTKEFHIPLPCGAKYWKDQEGLYVNLFIPSELDWAEKGFKVRQETRYPESEEVTLTVTEARPDNMTLHLRIPS